MSQVPLAVVGHGCVLPGAFSLDELWAGVVAGRVAIGDPPDGPLLPGRTAPWSDRGGYVSGFAARFRPEGFAVPPEEILALDPFVHWVLHAARQALRQACPDGRRPPRTGAIFGNLLQPSRLFARYSDSVRLAAQPDAAWRRAAGARPDPRSRFVAGLPAQVLARALGLEAGAFALDAACASSIYAMKLAGDWLADGRADLVLAGGVCGCDPLALRYGFHALQAASPTGRSLPLRRGADGLLPAEGAAFVALKRLEDAERAGDPILAVIRGIGLSNDGGSRALLSPAAAGQAAAMRAAYTAAGLHPEDIGLVECHATGTPVGDAVELQSLSAVFGPRRDLVVGSLKANLGHLLTASGAAGLLKVIGALRAGVLPPSPGKGEPLAAPFRLLEAAEPWDGARPRRAALSGFGFGGNNAHAVIEEWMPPAAARPHRAPAPPSGEVAIVGLGCLAGGAASTVELARALLAPAPDRVAGLARIELPLAGLRLPPHDLGEGLPQQAALLQAVAAAVAEIGPLPPARTGVFVGLGCDGEIGRVVARLRVEDWLDRPVPPTWLEAARDRFGPHPNAAIMLSLMANIPANRASQRWDLTGPSFALCGEELSGIHALEVAARALRAREMDAAVVAAVDLSREPVHAAAAAELLPPERSEPGDGAVAMVLKRLADAERDGDAIYAVLAAGGAPGFPDAVTPRFGHAHAASGLLQVAAAALACRHGARPDAAGAAWPWIGERRCEVRVTSFGGAERSVGLRAARDRAPVPAPLPGAPLQIHVYAGRDRADVLAALAAGRSGGAGGPARLALVAAGQAELARRADEAARLLAGTGEVAAARGIHYHDAPVGGALAFVFGGAAAAYPGAGSALLLAFPEALAPGLADPAAERDALATLAASSLLCQAHAAISRDVLRLRPDAAIGLSSGESNALAALGIWSDLGGLLDGLRPLYEGELGGGFAAVRRAWGLPDGAAVRWANWRLLHPVADVEAALAGEALVHLTLIHAPCDCAIGGDAAGCARVIARLGGRGAVPLAYDLAVHCPEVAEVAGAWRAVHRRPVVARPGVVLYGAAATATAPDDADAVADALLAMACGPVDLPRMVEAAWRDGVRVFVEHGPRDLCTSWIRDILGDRPHLAVALDRVGADGLRSAAEAVAELAAAGVACDVAAFNERMRVCAGRPAGEGGPMLRILAHPAPVVLPPLPEVPAGPEAGLGAAAVPPSPSDGAPLDLEPADSPVPERMSPAPDLAPVDWGTAPEPAAREPLRVPEAASLPLPPAATALIAHQRRVAAIHRGYLGHQADLHGAYTRVSASPWRWILGMAPEGAAIPPAILGPAMAPAAAPPPAPAAAPAPRALALTRADLERVAAGRVSDVLGPAFRAQDGYRRQVRMPMPPLLLADRVTSLVAEPLSMGLGVIETETDVAPGAWYLHQGRMPAGLMVEAGQADLLLVSWLGADAHNRGERVYRLLGCDLTFHGPLPEAGETLHYRIQIDGHARQGDVRLFFFHYDCFDGEGGLRLSVRHGQAGFFSDAELAASHGVAWDPARGEHRDDGPLDPPAAACVRRAFPDELVAAFAGGRAADCFGPGFEATRAHVRTPRIPDGRMRLLDRVTDFDPAGGPWGRGYLRAETDIAEDAWFFPCHFRDDPVMPGTLMVEACQQAMAFYLTAMGHTLDRDGWRFEPVPGKTWRMQCRGQVVPGARRMVSEVFVEDVSAGAEPTLHADVLVTVDGLKVFHGRRMAVRLVPGWPLEALAAPAVRTATVATVAGVPQDERAMLACAWGPPSSAFGEPYLAFDGPRRIPRLPGPPYLFMSRVVRVDGAAGRPEAGASVEAEYDVPPDAWYFAAGGGASMPFAVLLEVALQPCGWLTAYLGIPLGSSQDLAFRNLDGTGAVRGRVGPGAGTITTRVRVLDVSRVGDTVIESFRVECVVAGETAFATDTVFGHFPRAALAGQVGLAPTEAEREAMAAAANADVDLAGWIDEGDLRVLDRVTGYWAEGPDRVRARAERRIAGSEWYFRAHFFQDPVQPGSLGLEAMLQLLRFTMLREGMAEGVAAPRFEALDRPLTWKYRGQVLPSDDRVTVTLALTERGRDFAVADAALWVGARLIYRAGGLGLRIVSGAAPVEVRDSAAGARLHGPRPDAGAAPVEVLDPAVDTWLHDHRPTYTVPVLPFTFAVDRMAAAARRQAPGQVVVGVARAEIRRWIRCAGPTRIRTRVVGAGSGAPGSVHVVLEVAEGERGWLPAASADVRLAPGYPEPEPGDEPAPLRDVAPGRDPYAADMLFHGPALQLLRELEACPGGARGVVDAGACAIPAGCIHPALLDAAAHTIAHDAVEVWLPGATPDCIGYPRRITDLRLFGPPPAGGLLRCEMRPDGFDGHPRLPAFRLWLFQGARLWATFRLVEALLPKGPLGRGTGAARRAFLRDRVHVPGAGLAQPDGDATVLALADLAACDWLPGTVAAVYGAEDGPDLPRQVAIKDHVARRAEVHPSSVRIGRDGLARCAALPLNPFPVHVRQAEGRVTVQDAGPAGIDVAMLRRGGREATGAGPSITEDILLGLVGRFVDRLRLTAPEACAGRQGRGRLYLGNHQTLIESTLFSAVAGAVGPSAVRALAKVEVAGMWMGQVVDRILGAVGREHPCVYFDQADPRTLLPALGRLRAWLEGGGSGLIHVEGIRARQAGAPVANMSAAVVDLAVAAGVAVVPVRFLGGLPTEPAGTRLDFPVGFGRQEYRLGPPVDAAELSALPPAGRRRRVLAAINDLGPGIGAERPASPDPEFAAAVAAWVERTGAEEPYAVLWATLAELAAPSPETVRLLQGAADGCLRLGSEPGDRLLGWLAHRLYGPRGPRIEEA